ncbi:MAG: hypothetical protein RBS01_03260 [Candidatus Dojkabacteria bacterium]|jgi:hypothetical protein|nr:hypothetical protein [Candidatus Dojkabacteria bacterium]
MGIEDKYLKSRLTVNGNGFSRGKPSFYGKREHSFIENQVLNEESAPVSINEEEREQITEDIVNKLYDEELGDFKGVLQEEIISAYENGCLVAGMTMDDFIEYVDRPDLSEDF